MKWEFWYSQYKELKMMPEFRVWYKRNEGQNLKRFSFMNVYSGKATI